MITKQMLIDALESQRDRWYNEVGDDAFDCMMRVFKALPDPKEECKHEWQPIVYSWIEHGTHGHTGSPIKYRCLKCGIIKSETIQEQHKDQPQDWSKAFVEQGMFKAAEYLNTLEQAAQSVLDDPNDETMFRLREILSR